MNDKQRDIFLAGVLLCLGIGWTATVWITIPGGFAAGDIGARGFPLGLGIALVLLSGSLGIKTAMAKVDPAELEPEDGPKEMGSEGDFGLVPLGLVVAHIIAYGFLMEKLGFLITTVLIVSSMLVICVGMRTIWKIAAYSVGTSVVSWLIFAKLMGVHLPYGTWITFG